MEKTPIPRMDIVGNMKISVIAGLSADEGAKAKTALFGAFVQAQKNLEQPTKDKTGAQFKNGGGYKYADLNSVIAAIQKAIDDLDIAYIQQPVMDGGKAGVHNYLLNSKGAIMDLGSYVLDVGGSRPQDAGGAMTYARRYSISSIFGIASEEDTDAQEYQPKIEFYSPAQIATMKLVYHSKRVPITDIYAKAMAGDEDASAILKDKKNPAKVKIAIKSITSMWDYSKKIAESQQKEEEQEKKETELDKQKKLEQEQKAEQEKRQKESEKEAKTAVDPFDKVLK